MVIAWVAFSLAREIRTNPSDEVIKISESDDARALTRGPSSICRERSIRNDNTCVQRLTRQNASQVPNGRWSYSPTHPTVFYLNGQQEWKGRIVLRPSQQINATIFLI